MLGRYRRVDEPDVDLLVIVAAIGAASIGQVMDGALLIVIFATSGALEALATARTRDAVRGLLDLAPTTVSLLADNGIEESVPTEDLVATITGEPLPVAKETG
ncbi:heavy metal translocating P-type ATPase [Streptomyces atroolivaceus]